MPSEVVIQAANIMQMAVPFVSLTAYIPQWMKILRTRSSANISMAAWLIWLLNGFFGLFYAVVQFQVHGVGLPLVISALAVFIFVAITVVMIAMFRKQLT